MALNIVSPGKEKSLLERMQALGVREQDIEEQFVRSSGAGGQKVNKTSSCVVLYHRPTGIRVKCQQERSQALNRFLARRKSSSPISATRRRRNLHGPACGRNTTRIRRTVPVRRRSSPYAETSP